MRHRGGLPRSALVRSAFVLVAVCAFACLDALVKGHHGGVRNAVGNVSAPWALVPFLAGAFVKPRRLAWGGLVGAAATIAALACYSVVRAVVVGAGQHRTLSSAIFAAGTNRWFLLGAVGGALLGAMGARLAFTRQWGIVRAVVASLLLLEPAARILWAFAKGEPARTLVPSPAVWLVEIACGCAVVIAFRCELCRAEGRRRRNR